MKKILAVIIVLLLFLSCPLISAAKTKTYKITAYQKVYKSGNVAYCCDSYNIFRVNLKNGEVLQLTETNDRGGLDEMKLYKGYIYYLDSPPRGNGEVFVISRVSTSGDSHKQLAKMINNDIYAISGTKIYYHRKHYSYNVMNLDGKAKKTVKKAFKIDRTTKNTNVKKYRIRTFFSEDYDDNLGEGYCATYLVKPTGEKIELAVYFAKDIICDAKCDDCGWKWECKIGDISENGVCPNCGSDNVWWD